jgi:SAM-dependent methyltransferase
MIIPATQHSSRTDRLLRRFYPESRYGGFTAIDGTVDFYLRVNALLHPEDVVLDFGCGRGQHSESPTPTHRALTCVRGKVARVIGLDVDAVGIQNPLIDEFRRLEDPSHWPVEKESVNLILCDSVLEHLPEPSTFFREAARALRRGGHVCIRTPNALSYVGLFARVIPNRCHTGLLSKIQSKRQEADVFPTLYRCNTISRLRKTLKEHGFDSIVYGHETEPMYLSFSTLTYWLGVLHQRFAPRMFAPAIVAFGTKPA